KIMVTGSSGTIGTRLCEKLLENDYEVVGVDYVKNKWSKKVQNITIDLDLRNKEDVLNKLPKDIDLVIHLAANARVYNLVVDPLLARDNFETIFNILEFTRLNKIKKVMFSSSREVYGNSSGIIRREDDIDVKNCESPYTATKIGGEALIHSYQQCYGIDFVMFRFSNVYGMYDDSDRVIPLFTKFCKEGKDLTVYGKEKLLDFTYIDDTVNGILLSIQKFNQIKNNVFNLAYGEGTSILEVAQLIKDLLKSKNKIKIKKNRTGEVVKYIADISKAQEKIGYNPQTDIFEGVKKSIDWYSKNI
ncbi:NAD-dependent epimerase/dehydratase family protein, partial [Patescibacteria group bacterium]|nr:NAD-dependent epimerase/dehydratase family protein [Patescibacteria group bacterium]